MNGECMGLPVDGPPSEWMAVKAVGSVVCINQTGAFEIWHFESDGLQNWEAMGMLTDNLAIRKATAPDDYWQVDIDWEDIDHDEE